MRLKKIYLLISTITLLSLLFAACDNARDKSNYLFNEKKKLFHLAQDSIAIGKYKFAERAAKQIKAEANDSDTYYLAMVLESKMEFCQMDTKSFNKKMAMLNNYLDRQPKPLNEKQTLLDIERKLQMGVYHAKFTYNLDSALIYNFSVMEQIKAMPKKNINNKLLALHNIADIYKFKGQYDLSISYFRQALKLADCTKQESNIYIMLGLGISSAYTALDDFENSKKNWDKAGELTNEMSHLDLFIYYNNRGNDYFMQGKYKESLECFLAIDSLTSANPQYVWERMYTHTNMADVYLKLNMPEKAAPLIERVDSFFQKKNYDLPLYYIETMRIEYNLITGNHAKALELAARSSYDGKKMPPEQQILRMRVLTKLYETTGHYANALAVMKELQAIADSVKSNKVKMNISGLLMQYDYEKQQIEHKQELEKHNTRFLVMMAFIVALVTILLFIIYATSIKLKQKQLKETEMLHNIVSLRMENIRNRITPHFIYNALNHEMLAQMKGKEVRLNTLVQLLRRGVQMADIFCTSLKEELEFIDFYVEIESQSMRDKVDYVKNVDSTIDIGKVRLPSMIIQILVENAIKHGLKAKIRENGESHLLQINVRREKRGIIIEVIDNGTGLGTKKSPSVSTGLKVIRQTIAMLNDTNKKAMDFGLEDYTHPDGSTGCRSWLYLPNEYKCQWDDKQ